MAEMDVTVHQDCPDETVETGVRDDRESEELWDCLDLAASVGKLANKENKDTKDLTGVQAHKVLKVSQDLQVRRGHYQKNPGLPRASRSWLYIDNVV